LALSPEQQYIQQRSLLKKPKTQEKLSLQFCLIRDFVICQHIFSMKIIKAKGFHMALNLDSSNVATRENRIGPITGYIDILSDLAEQSGCGTLKGCSRCFSQSSTCLSSCALGQLSAIRDVAIIHHEPAKLFRCKCRCVLS